VYRLDEIWDVVDVHTNGDLEKCNCLIIDVQGLEMEVLRGMGKYLSRFEYISAECSSVPVYAGSTPAIEVIDWMAEQGYDALKIYDHDRAAYGQHNDVLFVARRVTEL
jgi:hypothetical protein